MKSNSINIQTKFGKVSVMIFDSNNAVVYSADQDARIQVGKFWYRVSLRFVRDAWGNWNINSEYLTHSIYRTEGNSYWTPPAKTIKVKIEKAAKEALLQAIAANPTAMVDAEVARAKSDLSFAKGDLAELMNQLAAAQQKVAEAQEKLDKLIK